MYSTLNLTQTIFDNNVCSGLFLDNSTVNVRFSNFSNTYIELSYKNDFSIENSSICGDILHSNPSLDMISGTPIYCGNYEDVINLSARYDGREHNFNTSVKNQGTGNNCWAFATLATLESCLLKANNQNLFDLSEENMKNVIARFSDYGLNEKTNSGGNFPMVSGYLSSWLGPVLDVDDVYCPSSTLSPILDSCMHIQNIYYIPFRMELIKEAVYKYGSVYYGFLFDIGYLNSVNYNYNGSFTNNISGHAVSIIGWDDNYSRENFNVKPENDGAWIVKNSWGSTSQNDGYWYISYENNKNTKNYTTFFTFILNDTNRYNHNYQYDIAYTDYKNNSENIYYSNNFTSSQNEVLSAVSTYFISSNIIYEILIKVNNTVIHTQYGFMENVGYYTIPLTRQLSLNKNDKFEIVFHLYSNNGEVYAPFCNDKDITHILYPSNSSRYSWDNDEWWSLNNGVFCIKAFTLLNKTEINIIPLNDTVHTKYNQNNIIFQILDKNNFSVTRGRLILNINNINYTADVVNGLYVFNNIPLSHVGLFSSFVYYIDDVLYENANITYDFINKEFLDVNITFINPYYGQNQKIRIEMPENTQITLQFNNTHYFINETQIIELGMLNKGNYSILIYYEDNYYMDSNVFNFTVLNERYFLIANNVTKYYKGPERFNVTLMHTLNQSVENKTVKININGVEYSRTTDENGIASMALGLPSNEYSVIVTFGNETVNSVVTILSTINGTDVVKMYKNGTQYYATFLNTEGEYLANGITVKFNINGVMYDRKVSGDKGLAKLNINLPAGEYIITAINLETTEMAANNITVLSKIAENKDITKYYKNGTQYTVKILGDDGNPVGAGENVTFNINGVFYTRTTNESGISKLNINLAPGDYIITAEYSGCKVSNNITVLNVLSAQDITMRYRDGTKFVATLLDGQGKPYAGQTVNFNINGVLYNRVTDSSGQAKLNINLMAGVYIITSSYNGYNIANKVTVTA